MASLVHLLERASTEYAEQCCAVDAESGRRITYAELHRQAERVAAALATEFSVQPGEHVALLLPNTLDFLPVYFGIQRAGATAVPVNARLKSEELEFILQDCEARTLFVHPRTWPAASGALSRATGINHLVTVGFDADGLATAERPGNSVDFDELLVMSAAPPALPDTNEDDVAAIIYTSGTTGQPKGAMLTHGNILCNVEATKANHGLRPEDVHLLVVPLFHVTGLNTIMPTSMDQGGSLVVSSKIDPEDLLITIHKHGCTTFFGVPTTFYLLTNLADWPLEPEALTTLRLICYSGAPMSPQTISKLRDLFAHVELHNFFGLTETTSVSTVLPDDQALKRPESVGLPPPGLELRIEDEEGNPLPPGQVGELLIKGGTVFKGYFHRPEATKEALRGGWFHTGDTALLDDDGYLYLQGRKKEMIIVAGENVYPIEVENALCAHPAVQEAAVFGRPNKALGEVVHAAVVLRPEENASERELKRSLMDRLAAFKQPRTIRILDKLPRNPSGKVMKRDL